MAASRRLSTPGHDFDDFEAVAGSNLTLGKLGRSYCFAIVLHHHTAWEKILCLQELLERTRQLGFDSLAIGDD